MADLLHFAPALLLFGLITLFLFWRFSAKPNASAHAPPEPPGAWPILGHLPLIGNTKHIAHSMTDLASKYGNLFTLRFGLMRAVVVSSREIAAECYTAVDKVFVDRPQTSSGKHLGYDFAAFGFANGPYWREMRKIATVEVLSTRSLDAMRNLRVSEISRSIQQLYGEAAKGQEITKIGLSRWVEQVTLNIIVKTLAGKRYDQGSDEVKNFRKQMSEFTFLAGEFVLYDVIPIPLLKWIDPRNYVKRMNKVSKELDIIVETWIHEHLVAKTRGEVDKGDQDFIDVMLSIMEHKNQSSFHGAIPSATMKVIKATVVNVILGGYDTTSVFIIWALSLLVKNEHILRKAQQEIDTTIGKGRWVQESDISGGSLPYLQAVLKETLRLYPPLPLSIPRLATEDCRIAGYQIMKGTMLFMNLWKIHRDPEFWVEPEKFMPERFLGDKKHVDFMSKDFEYAPFGAGRRSCPGMSFAMQLTSLLIGRLIQGFDFHGGVGVDMEEGLGITMPRAHPLEVGVTPRLSSSLYA